MAPCHAAALHRPALTWTLAHPPSPPLPAAATNTATNYSWAVAAPAASSQGAIITIQGATCVSAGDPFSVDALNTNCLASPCTYAWTVSERWAELRGACGVSCMRERAACTKRSQNHQAGMLARFATRPTPGAAGTRAKHGCCPHSSCCATHAALCRRPPHKDDLRQRRDLELDERVPRHHHGRRGGRHRCAGRGWHRHLLADAGRHQCAERDGHRKRKQPQGALGGAVHSVGKERGEAGCGVASTRA